MIDTPRDRVVSRGRRGANGYLQVLTDAEAEQLLVQLAEARGPRGYSLDEARELLSWANGARGMSAIVDLVFAGRVRVDLRNGEVTLRCGEVAG